MSKSLVTDKSVVEDIDTSSSEDKFYNRQVNPSYLIIAVVVFLVSTANFGFFKQVIAIYPVANNIGFIISLTGLLFGLMWLLFQLLCYRPTIKVVLIAMVLIAAICGYFTDAYGTVFDTNMLINSLQTDQAEATGLMSLSLIIRVLLLGVLPAFIISKVRLKRLTWRRAIVQKAVTLIMSIALIALCLLPFGDQYASFFVSTK